jgi:hypothetical protein
MVRDMKPTSPFIRMYIDVCHELERSLVTRAWWSKVLLRCGKRLCEGWVYRVYLRTDSKAHRGHHAALMCVWFLRQYRMAEWGSPPPPPPRITMTLAW